MIYKRDWIRSGIIEELDGRQNRLLELVLEKIKYYYSKIYGKPGNKYPLSIGKLMRLTKRSGSVVVLAVKTLAHTIPKGSDEDPPIYYDRIKAKGNSTHRPYRIFLRKRFY